MKTTCFQPYKRPKKSYRNLHEHADTNSLNMLSLGNNAQYPKWKEASDKNRLETYIMIQNLSPLYTELKHTWKELAEKSRLETLIMLRFVCN